MRTCTLDLLQFQSINFPCLILFPNPNMFLRLEVGIRFKALYNESNTKCSVVEIYQR